ncbi:MAG: hypothetical protein K2N16_01755 [Muribaculaceae bacterium]|nr:hypothetical protein [Muribaculaceae bacterium]
MTQDQQDRLIEKALSEPQLLTAEEADAIMADPGLRQLLSAAALLKAAAQPAPECDVEAEWQAFRRQTISPRRRKPALWRAAAVIAVAIGAAAAFLGLRQGSVNENIALFDTTLRDTLVLVVEAEPAPMMVAQAPTPVPKAVAHKPKAAEPKVEEIDPVVMQARVDNEIAMIRAEYYRNIAATLDIDFPEDLPVPDFQIDGPELSLLTAQ